MANCPKCGYHLRMIDIKPTCPKCGVNLLYYNHQERLAEDADAAEEEHIRFQPKIDRVKFSFIGSKWHIIRLILIFLPIGSLFLPLAHVQAAVPYNGINSDVSILTLVSDVLGNLNLGVITAMIGESKLTGTAFICFLLAIVCVFLTAICALLNLFLNALSSSPKGFKRNMTLSCLGLLFAAVASVSFLIFNAQLSKNFGEVYSGNLGIGAIVLMVGFVLLLAINVIIKKKNIPVKYKDVSEYVARIEKRKQEIAEMEAEARAAREAEGIQVS